MAIDSVGSSTSAQPIRAQLDTEQARSSEEARKADEARRKKEEEQQAQQTKQPESRPVVNTQGQTTGQIVNVTA